MEGPITGLLSQGRVSVQPQRDALAVAAAIGQGSGDSQHENIRAEASV